MIINSLVDYTPDWQGRVPGFDSRRGHSVLSYVFAIITIFLQQPGTMKIPNSKLDLQRYPQFLCENLIECK
jgi:hypothetical protein